MNTAAVLRVNLTVIKVLGWVSLILFLAVAMPILLSESGPHRNLLVLFFAIFSLGGLYLLLSSGPIEVNYNGVALITPLARYYIRWDEVELIETDSQGQAIVFRGANKCLPLLGPGWWSGKEKADVIEFIQAQIQERGITVKETGNAVFRITKNAKVRKPRD
jgi:hypothetical protein